jgi:hypothetical protein
MMKNIENVLSRVVVVKPAVFNVNVKRLLLQQILYPVQDPCHSKLPHLIIPNHFLFSCKDFCDAI